MAGARARHRATPPARLPACPPLLARCPGRRHALPPALSHSPSVLPSSPSLPLSRPNTTIAAVRHSSRHRPPLAPPTSPEAPPRPPLPPHRSTGLRKPCIAAHVAVPLLGHRKSPPFDSPPTGRPRAHLASRPTPRELLFSSPHSPHLISSPSSFFHHGRSSPPPCLVAVVARATVARSRAHHRAPHLTRST